MNSSVGHSTFAEKSLAICLLLPTFLLYNDIPFWAFSSALVFWFYRIILDRSGWKVPSRLITGFFALIFLGITYFNYKTLLGRDASSTFLVLLLSLKILEYRDSRDNGLLILIGFYLITVKFLYASDLLWFSLGFPVMILLIYFLLPSNFRLSTPGYASLYLLRSLFLSLPLGLFLFFYFPRFSSNSFFQNESHNKIEGVGFSDSLDPGSVSSLVQSDEIVLRAEFRNFKSKVLPNVNSLYWRGAILTKQNGMKWERDTNHDQSSTPTRPLLTSLETGDEYVQVTLDPTYKNWIFSLEQTKNIYSDQITILKSTLGNYFSDSTIDSRVTYKFTYDPALTHPQDSKDSKIEFDRSYSNAVRDFIHNLKKDTHTNDDIVAKFSEFLIKEKFQYTIDPGEQGNLTLDDFLFKTKKGFCEHYASSLASILNYLNIPARVITGYHGGEYNPIGQFWTVRQRDAHAWIEYIDSHQQWRRFDPTAVIAPLRLTMGAMYFDSIDDSGIITNNSLVNQIQYLFENLNYRWNYLFLNFDLEKQKSILQQLDISLAEAIVFGLFSLLIISLSLSWLLRSRKKIPRSQKIFLLINDSMKKFHLEKGDTEGPLSWKQRLIAAFPNKETELKVLIECYLAEAYQNRFSKHNYLRAKQILNDL